MKITALLSGLCAVSMMLWSCGSSSHDHKTHHEGQGTEDVHDHEGEDPHGHEAVHGTETAHSDEIIISPEKAEAAGILTEKVVPAPFSGAIRTGGRILPAQGDEKTVVATSDGIISFSGEYFEGTGVEKGQPVFSILSGNIQDGDRIGKARIAYEAAESEYERAAGLVDSKIISRKEFIQIKENYENARMAYEALKPNADGTGVLVEAPFSGFIRSIFVKEGDFVTLGTPLASVTQNRKLILKADLSQRYYDRIHEITSANFATQYGGKTMNIGDLGGKLISVGKGSADSSYYIPVTFEFENRGNIVPGSFAEVWLLTSGKKDAISVPVSAITEEQGIHFVYLKLDGSCYRKQEVTIGGSDGTRTEILSGLKAGDEVVTEGAYNVRLASASNIIPAHTHNH